MKPPIKPPVRPSWDQAAINPEPRLDGGAVLPAFEVDGVVTYPKPIFPSGFFYENAAFYNSDLSLDMWCKSVGMTFQEAHDILSCDLPPEIEVRIFLQDKGVNVLIRDPKSRVSDDRMFFLDARYVGKGRIFLDAELRGSAIGSCIVRNQIEWGCRIGMTHMKALASSEIGGWVWAHKGFPLDVQASPSDLNILRQRLNHRLSVIRHHPVLLPHLKELTRCVFRLDRWDLQYIAQMNAPLILPADVRGKESRPQKAILEKIGQCLTTETEDDLYDKIPDLMPFLEQQVFVRKQPVTVGQFMLIGAAWPIRIDFDDAKVMTRLGQTLGGWKYIDPETGKPVKRDVAPAP